MSSSKEISRFLGGEKGKPDLLSAERMGLDKRSTVFSTACNQRKDSKFRLAKWGIDFCQLQVARAFGVRSPPFACTASFAPNRLGSGWLATAPRPRQARINASPRGKRVATGLSIYPPAVYLFMQVVMQARLPAVYLFMQVLVRLPGPMEFALFV
jgi:hypothetical protein